MTVLIMVAIAVLLFVIWNVFLPFYRDPYTKPLVADESKCFSEKCRSIVYEQGSDECVLMIHGYPTCPDMYSYTAARLRDAGYDVHVPLIPTFGYGYIDQYYIALRQRYARVYVVGVSMGGAMTLKLAEEHSATPLAMDAIVSIASPVAYNCLHLGIITNPLGYHSTCSSRRSVLESWTAETTGMTATRNGEATGASSCCTASRLQRRSTRYATTSGGSPCRCS